MPQTPGQNGQSQMQDFPQGQMGNGFGGEFGGQMQGGPGMGRPGEGSNGAAEEQGSAKEALYAGVSIVLLLLSCLFVTLYKRKGCNYQTRAVPKVNTPLELPLPNVLTYDQWIKTISMNHVIIMGAPIRTMPIAMTILVVFLDSLCWVAAERYQPLNCRRFR